MLCFFKFLRNGTEYVKIYEGKNLKLLREQTICTTSGMWFSCSDFALRDYKWVIKIFEILICFV